MAIGATATAYWTATSAAAALEANGHIVMMHGAAGPEDDVDYPVVAAQVGRAVASGEVRTGVLIDESTVGMEVAANKIEGIRAVPCRDEPCIKQARDTIDANVLCVAIRNFPTLATGKSPLYLIAKWVESFP